MLFSGDFGLMPEEGRLGALSGRRQQGGCWESAAALLVLLSWLLKSFPVWLCIEPPCQLCQIEADEGDWVPDVPSSWLLERRGQWSWEAFGGSTDQMDLYGESV